jgi:type II secretory pathway component PulC
VALQLALGAICGYLTWSIVATLVWAAPLPVVELDAPDLPQPQAEPLSHYTLISQRNLFRSQAGQGEAPPPTDEPLVESKLSVKLHGTAATTPPEFGVAAVEDLKTREHLQVRAGDVLQGARVVRIERSRIVVDNAGRLEEILLEDEAGPASGAGAQRGRPASGARTSRARPAPRSTRSRENARSSAARVTERVRRLTQRLAASQEDGPAASPQTGSQAAMSLFREADLRPELDGTAMVGMVVGRVSKGSRLESAGLQAGDVITGVNGTSLQGGPQGIDLAGLAAAQNGRVDLQVDRGGQTLSIAVEAEAP